MLFSTPLLHLQKTSDEICKILLIQYSWSVKDKRKKAMKKYFFFLSLITFWIIFTCTATTNRSSAEMQLNSKYPQAPIRTKLQKISYLRILV